jgi:predicted kinase
MKLKVIKEAPKDLKAVLIAGPSNAGKSQFVKSVIPTEYQKYVLNPDKFYEPELAKVGQGSMDMKDFTPDQLSAAAKAQAVAVKQYRSELEKAIGEKPVILDITGGSYKKVAETKAKLESQGYEVMMVLLYASPYTTLSRNIKRDRSLDPGIVLRNWEDVIKNADKRDADTAVSILYNMEFHRKIGFYNWYDWSIHNWGVKWDAGHSQLVDIRGLIYSVH